MAYIPAKQLDEQGSEAERVIKSIRVEVDNKSIIISNTGQRVKFIVEYEEGNSPNGGFITGKCFITNFRQRFNEIGYTTLEDKVTITL